MHSTRPLWQLEEKVRNHLKLGSNTILVIMRPGCLILTATILRSSIKTSNIGPITREREMGMSSKLKNNEIKEPQETSTHLEAGEVSVGHSARDEKIRGRAYEIYFERGEQPGRDLDDWLQAER